MAERLNDLSGTEWLPATRSVFVDGVEHSRAVLTWDRVSGTAPISVISTATARPADKKKHPATFPESDARRIIRLLTRKGEHVLDPFMGRRKHRHDLH